MNRKGFFKNMITAAAIAGFGLVIAAGAGKAYARMYPAFGADLLRIEEYSAELDLTPDQEKQFRELLKSERAKFEELADKHRKQRLANREEMEALRDSANDSAKKILTPEQYKKLREMMRSDRAAGPDRGDYQRHRGMMRDGYGGPDCGYGCGPDRERARDRDCYGPGCNK